MAPGKVGGSRVHHARRGTSSVVCVHVRACVCACVCVCVCVAWLGNI